jgi:hypothetical protein
MLLGHYELSHKLASFSEEKKKKKKFWTTRNKAIALGVGALALAGAGGYALYKMKGKPHTGTNLKTKPTSNVYPHSKLADDYYDKIKKKTPESYNKSTGETKDISSWDDFNKSMENPDDVHVLP